MLVTILKKTWNFGSGEVTNLNKVKIISSHNTTRGCTEQIKVVYDRFWHVWRLRIVQISSNLAHFGVLEGNMVTRRPGNDSVRVPNILPRIVGGSTVQKCIKSWNSSIDVFRVHEKWDTSLYVSYISSLVTIMK